MDRVQMNNGAVTAVIPEGFSALTEAQIRELGGRPADTSLAFRDEDRHILLELMWRKLPLLGRMVPLQKHLEATAAQYRDRIPTYRDQQLLRLTVAGQEAAAFRYAYTAKDIEQTAEYALLLHGGVCYAFSVIGRGENETETLAALDAVLRSVTIG